MSHFTVLVIGDDVERQLAPFHEFECTGHDDEFVQNIDITDEVQAKIDELGLKDALEYYGMDDSVSDESQLDLEDRDQGKYRYAIVKDGKLVKAVKRTNPNAKWDWWVVGGRWSGMFKLKDGANGDLGKPGVFGNQADPGTADSCRKADVDIEGMRDKRGKQAVEWWDKIRAAIPEGSLQTFRTWESIRGPTDTLDMSKLDEYRKTYGEQPAVEAVRKNKDLGYVDDLDEVLTTSREDYEKRARLGAISTFAVVKDGKWYERGEMGWWACVSNEKAADAWYREFNTLFESLPDDTRITVVDCHI